MTEVISIIVAALGLAYAVYRDRMAKSERRRREHAERALAEERERKELRLIEPDIVVQLRSHQNEVGGRGRIMVATTVTNKGKSGARDLSTGLRYEGADARYAGLEVAADNGGRPVAIAALGEGETVRTTVALDQQAMSPLRAQQERIEDVMRPWARYSDKLGNSYEWPARE